MRKGLRERLKKGLREVEKWIEKQMESMIRIEREIWRAREIEYYVIAFSSYSKPMVTFQQCTIEN